MKNYYRFIFLLPVVFILASLFVLPAQAQQKVFDECTISKTLTGIKEAGVAYTINEKAVIKEGDKTLKTAAGADTIIAEGESGDVKKWAIICLLNTVNVITGWIFIIILALAIGLIAFAGFLWATSGANPNLQKTAKSMIMAAIVGFLIAIFAKLIPAIITGILFD